MLATVLVFLVIIGGAGLTLAARLREFTPLERLALGTAGALIATYLASFVVYLSGLDWRWLWAWPLGIVLTAGLNRRAIAAFLAEPLVRTTLANWSLVAVWSLGLQTLVFSYSGGTWAVDWIEHYERALFFLFRWPVDHVFVARYLLPARPPLINLMETGLLALAGRSFAQYQVASTLLSTLVFLPLAALTQGRGHSTRALNALVLLLLLSPLFAQNVTFAWTKLPAAFFVVLAVMLLLSRATPAVRLSWIAPALTAGVLTHYSVGPWIIALACGWAVNRGAVRGKEFPFRIVLPGLVLAGFLGLTWFGWAAWTFGASALASATSTFGQAPDVGGFRQLQIALWNVYYSLLPDFDSPMGLLLLQQREWVGRLRDVAFVFYQVNLLVVFGVGNLCALGWLAARQPAGAARRFVGVALPVVVLAGIGAHSRLEFLGLTHISLQPLVLLGLAWLASRLPDLPGWLRLLWLAGLVLDFLLGVVLHFGLQSLLLLRWLHPGIPSQQLVQGLSDIAVGNFENKYQAGQPFLADLASGWLLGVVVGLTALLLVVLWRARSAASAGVDPT
jgi:hypothetical protein